MKTMKFLMLASSLMLVGQVCELSAAQKAQDARDLKKAQSALQRAQDAREAARKEEQERQNALDARLKELAGKEKIENKEVIKGIEEAKKALDEAKDKVKAKEAEVKKAQKKADPIKAKKELDSAKANLEKSLKNFDKLSEKDQKDVVNQFASMVKNSDNLQQMLRDDKEFAKAFRGTFSKMLDDLGDNAKKSLGQTLGLKAPFTPKNLFRGVMTLAGLGGVAGLFLGDDIGLGDVLRGNSDGDVNVAVSVGADEDFLEPKPVGEALTDFAKDSKKIIQGALTKKGKELTKKFVDQANIIEQNMLTALDKQLQKVIDAAPTILSLGNKLLAEIQDDMQSAIDRVVVNKEDIVSKSSKELAKLVEVETKPLEEKLKNSLDSIFQAIRDNKKSYATDSAIKGVLSDSAEHIKNQTRDYFNNIYKSVIARLELKDTDEAAKQKIKKILLDTTNKNLEVVDQSLEDEVARKTTKQKQKVEEVEDRAETTDSAGELFEKADSNE